MYCSCCGEYGVAKIGRDGNIVTYECCECHHKETYFEPVDDDFDHLYVEIGGSE
jgi:hypothetical protein